MALINFPQAPTVSSVYAPKDSVAQLNYMNQSNAQALNNLLKLGSQIHDYSLSREQANLMEQPGGNEDQKMREIASIESRKINASDPSMIWRWKAQMDQQAAEAEKNRIATQNTNAAIRANDVTSFNNEVDMILGNPVPPSYSGKSALLTEVLRAKKKGSDLGLQDSDSFKSLSGLEKKLKDGMEEGLASEKNMKETITKIAELDKRLTNGTLDKKGYVNELTAILNESTDPEIIEKIQTKIEKASKPAKKKAWD